MLGNQPETKGICRVGSSETLRSLSLNTKSDLHWNQWLAGLIDGDGCLLVSKAGYPSCEITMGIEDERALMEIKQKLGGSVKLKTGAQALRYRLHNKAGMLDLVARINGHVRNSVRLKQLESVCLNLNIIMLQPMELTKSNGWFAGFFDACGKLDYKIIGNEPKLFVTVTHKLYYIVANFKLVFGGYIFIDEAGGGRFIWCLDSKDKILDFLQYRKTYPIRARRHKGLFLISKFYKLLDLKAYKAPENTTSGKLWLSFNNQFKRGFHTTSLNNKDFQKKKLSGNVKAHVSNSTPSNSLIKWGTIMGSGVSSGRITKQVSEMYKFTSFQYSVVIGMLLSDAWLIYSKGGKNPRLGFKQSIDKNFYLLKVFTILSPFCQSLPSLVIGKRSGILTFSLNFFTRSLPCIKDLHLLFYLNNKKRIPENIYVLLTPVAIAHWICGDGQKRDLGLVLCTDSYTIQDVVRLVNVLIIRYNLICFIRENKPNQYRIYISEKSMDKLRAIVLPHIDTTMLYKINYDYKKK